MSNDALIELIEAASAVVSNHEHAFSGGMCRYQKGSDTWQLFESLRVANDAASAAFRAGKFAAGRAAAPPAPVLPELPEPDGYVAIVDGGSAIIPPRDFAKHNAYAIFTATQMREYALAAIAAGGAK